MATLQECADAFWARLRSRPPGTPIRVVRVAMLQTKAWRADARFNRGPRIVSFQSTGRSIEFRDRDSDRCERLAATGELLGIERVGLAVGRDEVSS